MNEQYQGYLSPYVVDIMNMAAVGMGPTAISRVLTARGVRSPYNCVVSSAMIRLVLYSVRQPPSDIRKVVELRVKIERLQSEIDELENKIDVIIAATKSRRRVVNLVSSSHQIDRSRGDGLEI